MRLSAPLKIIALALLGLTLVLGVAAAVPGVPPGVELLAALCFLVGAHAVVGVGLATALERQKAPWLMRLGMVACVLAPVAWCVGSWTSFIGRRAPSLLNDVGATLTVAALAAMVVGMQLTQPANWRFAGLVQRVTVRLTAFTLVAFLALWWSRARGLPAEIGWRLFSVASLLIVAGLLTNLIMSRIHGLADDDEQRQRPRLTIVCPRCRDRRS